MPSPTMSSETVDSRATDQAIFCCPICTEQLPPTVAAWSFYCSRCDYWGSVLEPVTELRAKDEFLAQAERDDVQNPIEYLDELRVGNFRRILRHLSEQKPTPSGPVLEVGCGPGLFLTEAAAKGLTAVGIEPFEAMARRGQDNGCNIRLGLFPTCLEDSEQFDAIVFNDVFEHLPNAPEVLRTCLRHLVPGGLVVLNLPNSHGLFFRVSRLAAALGYRAPWNRMWQTMFYSPHLHYWSPESLGSLCDSVGFEPATAPIPMTSVSLKGLWRRIRAAPNTSMSSAIFSLFGALCCAAAVPLFPSDCYAQVFRKPR
jgi:SAM-dependent methyltransferase